MANPANLTVTDLVIDDSIVRPAGDTIDTDGIVPILAADLGGASHRLLIEVTNNDAANTLVVTIAAGQNPPAVREALGDYEVTLLGSGVELIGPLESARFMQNDGTIDVAFEETGVGDAEATVRAYLLPKA